MNEFIFKLEDLFELSKDTIKPEDRFREYEVWDSLALLSLMAMLEDEYNINDSLSTNNYYDNIMLLL